MEIPDRVLHDIIEEQLQQLSRPTIIGRQAREVGSFREQKLALREKGYPIRQTRKLVKAYLKENEDKFKEQLNERCILVSVPSGSGSNLLAEIFAEELSQYTGASLLSPGLFGKTHLMEAKCNLSLEKRLKDPIDYVLFDKLEFLDQTFGKRIVVIDDLIGSGESCVRLKQCIEKYTDQKVEAFANLITVENRYPTVADITRLVNKIKTNLPETNILKLTEKSVRTFGEFTRQKLNRLEREINSAPAAQKALGLIEQAAKIESEKVTFIKRYHENSFRLHARTGYSL